MAKVQTSLAETPQSDRDDAQMIIRLEDMIKNHIGVLEKSKKELSQQRDMLNDTFASDPVYLEQQEEVKKASKTRNKTKAEILQKANVSEIAEKVKALQMEIREYSTALSDYLREYQRVSGQNTLEGEGGEILEIIYIAKLKKVGKA